jgi:hypothetical protein
VVLVVSIDKVFDDGSRLPERHARIRILNDRYTAIGIDFSEWFFFHLGHILKNLCYSSTALKHGKIGGMTYVVVRQSKLFEDVDDFPRVGTADCTKAQSVS